MELMHAGVGYARRLVGSAGQAAWRTCGFLAAATHQVHDMDVVSDTASVATWIIIPKDNHFISQSDGSLCDDRHKIGGLVFR